MVKPNNKINLLSLLEINSIRYIPVIIYNDLLSTDYKIMGINVFSLLCIKKSLLIPRWSRIEYIIVNIIISHVFLLWATLNPFIVSLLVSSIK